jgi:hypothetical protein
MPKRMKATPANYARGLDVLATLERAHVRAFNAWDRQRRTVARMERKLDAQSEIARLAESAPGGILDDMQPEHSAANP